MSIRTEVLLLLPTEYLALLELEGELLLLPVYASNNIPEADPTTTSHELFGHIFDSRYHVNLMSEGQ